MNRIFTAETPRAENRELRATQVNHPDHNSIPPIRTGLGSEFETNPPEAEAEE